jgi:tetratricopeptide (TPR) repeat protein
MAHSLANVPRYFIDPSTYDALPRLSAYRPLLFTSFAVDWRFLGSDPRPFQASTFFWFVAQLLVMYGLFRQLSGGRRYVGLLAAALYGLHPALADTLDYTLQRGEVLEGVGITLALFLWIVFPKRLPQDLGLMMLVNRIPMNTAQFLQRRAAIFVTALWARILRSRFPFYVVPLVLALLAHPASSVFALLLLVYLELYEPDGRIGRVIPSAVLCGGYWLLQAALTWKHGVPSPVSFFAWLYTQPWIALRYLGAFFAPLNLSADWNLKPLPSLVSPEAIAGFAGVAVLIWAAIALGRRESWRAVSFGIWWFLITLLPTVLIPQPAVAADQRMYLPFAGLALALTSAAYHAFEKLSESPRYGSLVGFAAPFLAAAILPPMAWATYERNQVWRTEESLWTDVLAREPDNGRALMNYGLILISENEKALGNEYLQRSMALLPRDARIELQLAQVAAGNGQDRDAEDHFRRAIQFDPEYSAAYSNYSQWLLNRQRSDEAFRNATRAAKLNSNDLVARHTLIDIYAERSDWASLLRISNEALRVDPGDSDGLRGVRVAQTGVEEVRRVEKAVSTKPSVDGYLSLSVVYFRNRRYEDSVAAARKALSLRPDLAEAYFNMASVYHVMGREDDAIAALQEALRLQPNLQMAKDNLAWELAKKKELEAK